MKLGYCTNAFPERSLIEVIRMAAEYGYEAVQIPATNSNRQFQPADVFDGKTGTLKEIKNVLEETGLFISAISNHADSMLLLGPHGADTDHIFRGTKEEKIKFAYDRLILTAEAANALEVPVVVAFTGIENWGRSSPFPSLTGWTAEEDIFAERMTALLDKYREYGVNYAIEPNPNNFVYDIYSAERALEIVDQHPCLGFNLDPANMMYLGLRIENFIERLGERIFHVHAKDAEITAHNIETGGILMNGSWGRIDRAFRFRVPGWGDVPWQKIITSLAMAGYDYVLAYEHEDITMSREDGLKKTIHFLKPLILERSL